MISRNLQIRTLIKTRVSTCDIINIICYKRKTFIILASHRNAQNDFSISHKINFNAFTKIIQSVSIVTNTAGWSWLTISAVARAIQHIIALGTLIELDEFSFLLERNTHLGDINIVSLGANGLFLKDNESKFRCVACF